MTLSLGIDIGGTKIAGALVDDGRVVARARRETPAQDVGAIVAATCELVAELRDASPGEVVGLGVACAGFIDAAGSTVLFAPNLAWRDEPLKDRLEQAVDMPVIVENDANAAAWGEYRHGAGRSATRGGGHGVQDVLVLTLGTGVGGGVIADGRLLRGAHGIGGEVGHMRVVPGGHRCGCGNRGCLEQYASGSALVREARDVVRSGGPLAEALLRACGGDADQLTGSMVTEAAQQGDAASTELLADLGAWVGEGAASLAAVLDPALIILGGGVSAAGDLVVEPAQAAFERQLTGRGHRPVPRIVAAALGNDAGVVGAADIAVDDGR